jgi:phosphatidylglycerophosphate synthase
MLDRMALRLSKPALDRMADYAICGRITADQMSLAGLALGLFAALLIALGFPQIAILPLLAGRLADGLDGAIARGCNEQTHRGAFIDITFDFFFYAAVPLAFAIANPAQNALAGALLLAAFITTGSSFLAYASIAARRGELNIAYPTKGIYYLGGLTEGSETILLFLVCCIWPSWFPLLAYVFSALCLVTAATRLVAGWNEFAD